MILSTDSLSSITPKPSIVEDIDFLASTDSTQFPLADKLREINLKFYDVVTDLLAYNGKWEWDDTNKTTFPIATTPLVNAQQDYTFPSDFLKLLRIEVKDVSGNYVKLTEFDEEQTDVALSEFLKTPGMPRYYRTVGNSLELYPAPATGYVTMAAGLRAYYQRTMTEFTKNDAAVSPGFSPNFHRILSVGVALDYVSVKRTDDANLITNLTNMLKDLKDGMKDFYQKRNKGIQPKVVPRTNNPR